MTTAGFVMTVLHQLAQTNEVPSVLLCRMIASLPLTSFIDQKSGPYMAAQLPKSTSHFP